MDVWCLGILLFHRESPFLWWRRNMIVPGTRMTNPESITSSLYWIDGLHTRDLFYHHFIESRHLPQLTLSRMPRCDIPEKVSRSFPGLAPIVTGGGPRDYRYSPDAHELLCVCKVFWLHDPDQHRILVDKLCTVLPMSETQSKYIMLYICLLGIS